MDYAAQASDVGLTGRYCTVCDSQVYSWQQIAYTIHDEQSATVRCWCCHEALCIERMETLLHAANLARQHGADLLALELMTEVQTIEMHLRKVAA